jgi:hypothetical protein
LGADASGLVLVGALRLALEFGCDGGDVDGGTGLFTGCAAGDTGAPVVLLDQSCTPELYAPRDSNPEPAD